MHVIGVLMHRILSVQRRISSGTSRRASIKGQLMHATINFTFYIFWTLHFTFKIIFQNQALSYLALNQPYSTDPLFSSLWVEAVGKKRGGGGVVCTLQMFTLNLKRPRFIKTNSPHRGLNAERDCQE